MPYAQRKGVLTIGKLSTIFLNAGLRFLAALFLLSMVGCHYAEGVSTTLQQEDKNVFSRLAVVPFQQVLPDDDGSRTAHCPVCGAVFVTNEFSPEPEKILDTILRARLQRGGNFGLLDPENVAGVYRRLSSGAAKKTELPEILKKLGHELGAEGVVVGYVYRYREREGYPYSVKQPASVAFEIHLLRGGDGTQVWRGIFDKTQRTLTENMLQFLSFYRQKGRWATAAELAEEGMDEILKTFPGFREGQKD